MRQKRVSGLPAEISCYCGVSNLEASITSDFVQMRGRSAHFMSFTWVSDFPCAMEVNCTKNMLTAFSILTPCFVLEGLQG